MPAARLSRRRRSSLAITAFTPAKAGLYGIPKPVQFAPNVTPISYTNPDEDDLDFDMSSSAYALFPPSEAGNSAPARRRGRRRSSGHIPRPPNAFMLFRKDFVRQKHVPGSIEANHGSLSKIIGNCWRQLPLEEKRVWEQRARYEKAEHQKAYPNYKFKPVHNKSKKDERKKKAKTVVPPEEEARCEEVAQLLLEGKKGEELAEAVRALDLKNRPVQNVRQMHGLRRSSSVPLPISVPTLPFFGFNDISRTITPAENTGLYLRRASSVQPEMFYHPDMQFPFDASAMLPNEPALPDIQTNFSNPFMFGMPSDGSMYSADPLTLAPHELPFQWPPSGPSSTNSASPASTVSTSLPVFAPQPMHPSMPSLAPPTDDSNLYPDWSLSVMDAGQGDIDVSLFNQGLLDPSMMSAMGCAQGAFDTSLMTDPVFSGFNDYSLDQHSTGFM